MTGAKQSLALVAGTLSTPEGGPTSNCGGGKLKIIAAILERPVIEKILTHLGLDPQPLPKGRARDEGQDLAA